MKIKKIIIFFMILMLGCVECSATGTMMTPVGDIVSSGWGSRVNPVTGKDQPIHDGIDFASDNGTPVHVAADGVIFYVGGVQGYGNFVEVDHGNGIHTFYGHLDGFASHEGESVRMGDVIAFSGNTGAGTGPHLHFGLHIGCNENQGFLSGETTNPASYLDGSLVIPDSPMIGPDGKFYRGDDDEVNIKFDEYYDFAKPMRDAINVISKQCTEGIKLVQNDVKWLFFALVTIDLALAAAFNLFDEGWDPIRWLFERFLKYGFMLFMIVHWGDMIANSLKDYFVFMGAAAVGSNYETAGQILSDPSSIVQKGAYIISPVFTYIMNFSGTKIMIGGNVGSLIVAVVLALTILFCYMIIGFQLVCCYLEFYILASLSVVTVGWGGLKHTKFIAERGIGALFSVSIKLMVYSFLAVLMTETVKDYGNVPYDFYNYLKILLGSMMFVLLGSRVTNTAGKL